MYYVTMQPCEISSFVVHDRITDFIMPTCAGERNINSYFTLTWKNVFSEHRRDKLTGCPIILFVYILYFNTKVELELEL